MPSTMSWPSLTRVLILSALVSACCKRGPTPVTPLVVVERSRCLRHPPPAPPDPTVFSIPSTEIANLYARIEQLEQWARAAWAACKVP